MLKRFAIAGALTGCVALAQADGWRKGPNEENRQVWILDDAKGAASLTVGCWQPRVVTIRTNSSLLGMADPDGEIAVSFVSQAEEGRKNVDGWLLPDSQGVRLKESGSGKVVKWLQRKENIGRDVTFVLSNNGKFESHTFRNASRVCEGRG